MNNRSIVGYASCDDLSACVDVKVSVKSVVESIVPRYEKHFHHLHNFNVKNNSLLYEIPTKNAFPLILL